MAFAISAEKIADYARAAGLPNKDSIIVATAIALAESGGRVEAINSVPCVGLWQINCKNNMHGLTVEQAKNPATNAAAMVKISGKGANWQPWTTYTSGAYKKHLMRAQRAAGGLGPITVGGNPQDTGIVVGGDGPTGAPSDSLTLPAPMQGITDAIARVAETFRQTTLLAIPVVFALVLLILGIILLSRNQIKSVAGIATTVGTKGLINKLPK